MNVSAAQQMLSLAAAQAALRTNSGILYVPALQQARQTVETIQDGGNPQGQEIVSGPPQSVDLKA